MEKNIMEEKEPLGQNQTPQQEEEAAKKRRSRRLNLLILIGSILLFIAGVVLLIRQYVFIPGEYVAPATPTPTLAATATPQPDATPAPTPSPTPYVKKIPVTLHFVDREVSCPIQPVGIVPATDRDGETLYDEAGNILYTMDTLDTEKEAAWLETGPSPGEYGNAILNGHITWKQVAGVFSVLRDIKIGENIAVTMDDGSVVYFQVESVDTFPIDDYPAWVMASDTGDTRMTLITCGGEWNSSAGTHNDRIVVVAKPVEEGAAQPEASPGAQESPSAQESPGAQEE